MSVGLPEVLDTYRNSAHAWRNMFGLRETLDAESWLSTTLSISMTCTYAYMYVLYLYYGFMSVCISVSTYLSIAVYIRVSLYAELYDKSNRYVFLQ